MRAYLALVASNRQPLISPHSNTFANHAQYAQAASRRSRPAPHLSPPPRTFVRKPSARLAKLSAEHPMQGVLRKSRASRPVANLSYARPTPLDWPRLQHGRSYPGSPLCSQELGLPVHPGRTEPVAESDLPLPHPVRRALHVCRNTLRLEAIGPCCLLAQWNAVGPE